jgi:hypothetical protein
MKTEFESQRGRDQHDLPVFHNLSEQMLQEAVGRPNIPQQNIQRTPPVESVKVKPLDPNFRPTSVDIDQLLKDETINDGMQLDGLTKGDLRKLSVNAATKGDARRQQVAEFLSANFQDVTKLSSLGGNKITRADLGMYHDFLRDHELKNSPGTPNLENWKKIHFDKEKKVSSLPLAVELSSHLSTVLTVNVLKDVPSIATKLAELKATRPVALYAGLALGAAYLAINNHFTGRNVGERASAYYNGDTIRKHFHDEAAPAMKRLLGK